MKKIAFLVFASLLFAGTLFATETIKFRDQEVSATSVLAKIKPSKGTKSSVSSTLASIPSVSSLKGFQNIPSVVVIDLKADSKLAASASPTSSAKAKEAELARRIKELQDTGLFEYVEPDYIVHPNSLPTDSAFTDGTLWGLRNQGQNGGVSGADIDAVGAWQTTTGSSDVIVAVIDTGIRHTHTDLAANMWVNPGEIAGNGVDDDSNGYVDDVHGINAIDNSGNAMDTDGHGTHCAGTIGGVANGGGPIVGVAWNVRLMALKFLGPDGGFTSDAIQCIDYAISKGAHITSNSWGGGGFSQALADAIERANLANILFVAAAGNSGTDNDQQPHYPSNYGNSNVVAVAALDRSDNLAWFSCFGTTSVDLGAPGVAIYSSTAESDTAYNSYNGTSMATPHVSGVAALLKSRFPNASVAELKQRLLESVRPIPSLAGKSVTGGALDAAAALNATEDGVLEIGVSTSPAPARSGAPVVIRVAVADLYPVPGASVSGTFAAQGPLNFVDNGQFPDTAANDGNYAAQFTVPQTTLETLTLSLSITASGKQAIAGAIYQIPVLSPPSNDNFENRIILGNGTTSASGRNLESSSQPGEPKNPAVAGGKTVWWSWTPSFSGTVSIDTIGSDYDTTLAIYSGASLGNLVLLGANDDAVGVRSQLAFTASAGTEYLIQVDGYNGDTGQITLNYPDPASAGAPPAITLQPQDRQVQVGDPIQLQIEAANANSYAWFFNGNPIPGANSATLTIPSASFSDSGLYRCEVTNAFGTSSSREALVFVQSSLTAPPNDHFADSNQLAGYSGGDFGTNIGATGETGEPNHAGVSDSGNGPKSVWWTWNATEDGDMVIDTFGSDFDTTLAVYTGVSVNDLQEIASNDDQTGSNQSRVQFPVTAGTTYRIAVAGYQTSTGYVNLNFVFTPPNAQPPANDHLGSRIVLDANWTTTNGTNAFATGESGEPDHAFASTPLQSVWWEWTPTQNGVVVIDTFGSNFDTTLAVYTGTDFGNLQTIRSNDQFNGNQSRVQFSVTAGTTYLIAVDGWRGNTGDILLNRSLWQPPYDTGANYGGTWNNGSNGGTGFGPWNLLFDPSGGTAGALIADPATSGISGMSNQSFTLYGHQGFAYAQADRSLNSPLEVGQSFSLQWGINWDGNRGVLGNKGFNLYAGGVEVVNVNNAGNATITLNGADVGFGYGTQAMTWTFERISFDQLKVTANDRDGTGQFSTILTLGNSAINSFRLYASHMDTGDNRRSFYDNFIVSAAPATVAAYPASIQGLAAMAGYPSPSQGLIVNAENLTQALVATAPWGFQVSTDDTNFASTATLEPVGGLVSATFYVRLSASASVGQANGNLTLATYGADSLSIPLAGTVSSGYEIGYSEGYAAGLAAGGGGGYDTGFEDGIALLTGNATARNNYGLHSTSEIMEMNLGGVMIQSAGGGNVTLWLQLQSTPDLANQPFQNHGNPVQIPVQMGGNKGFMRIRALGPQ
jgi:subtilisin family serine protease